MQVMPVVPWPCLQDLVTAVYGFVVNLIVNTAILSQRSGILEVGWPAGSLLTRVAPAGSIWQLPGWCLYSCQIQIICC